MSKELRQNIRQEVNIKDKFEILIKYYGKKIV